LYPSELDWPGAARGTDGGEEEGHDAMDAPDGDWEILGIRQLAATDERAEEFVGTLLLHRPGGAEPVEPVAVRITRSVLTEMTDHLTRLLARSRGRR
jgi:hypothetical protein